MDAAFLRFLNYNLNRPELRIFELGTLINGFNGDVSTKKQKQKTLTNKTNKRIDEEKNKKVTKKTQNKILPVRWMHFVNNFFVCDLCM